MLHSAVTGPDSGEGELKLYGPAVEADQDLRGAARRGRADRAQIAERAGCTEPTVIKWPACTRRTGWRGWRTRTVPARRAALKVGGSCEPG